MNDWNKKLDEIIFRCFAQGQYWGTEKDGKLDPDYKPENPIDRTEALASINQLVLELIGEDDKPQYEDGGLTSDEFCNVCDHWMQESEYRCLCIVRNALRQQLRDIVKDLDR